MGLSTHTVSCPPGMRVFGGGGLVEGPDGNWLMTSSLAVSATAWYVAWLNIDQQTAATATGLAEVAICGTVISGTISPGPVLQPQPVITTMVPITIPQTPGVSATATITARVPTVTPGAVMPSATPAPALPAAPITPTGTVTEPVSTLVVPLGTPFPPAAMPMTMTLAVTASAPTANALMGTDMALTGTPGAPVSTLVVPPVQRPATQTPTSPPMPALTPAPLATGQASLGQWLAVMRCAVGLCT
jgi:hypothetical protein